ncbi:MAG: ABC transporter permease [Thermofilum sp. ex4484_15]|nr:MAG: ABC transporter permease [Thermofilum sp. ex4484_15]
MWKVELKYILFFLLPAFSLISLLYALTVWTFLMSFTNWSFGVRFSNLKLVGFANYAELASNPRFWVNLRNNIAWLILFVVPTTVLGLILAYLLESSPLRLERILRPIFLYPAALSFAVSGVLWSWIYDPWEGVFNDILFKMGFKEVIPWLDDPKIAIFPIITAAIWQYCGFATIIFLAALRSGVLKDAIEAAKVDGAGSARILIDVILPNLRHALLVVVSLLTIFSLKVFDLVWIMTRGGPGYATEVLAVYMYILAFQQDLLAPSAAVATIIVALTSAVLLPYTYYAIRRWSKRG